MNRQEFERLIKQYNANPKTCRYDWDGEKCTYFSIESGNKQMIGKYDGDDTWEIILIYGNNVYSTFQMTLDIGDYVELCLKTWEMK